VSRRTLIAIVAAVIAVHVGLFLVVGRMRALPKEHYIPPPNFGYKAEIYENPKTGEKTIWREIRVSTRLTPRSSLPPIPTPVPIPTSTPPSNAEHHL
jgi:hypothetical protein